MVVASGIPVKEQRRDRALVPPIRSPLPPRKPGFQTPNVYSPEAQEWKHTLPFSPRTWSPGPWPLSYKTQKPRSPAPSSLRPRYPGSHPLRPQDGGDWTFSLHLPKDSESGLHSLASVSYGAGPHNTCPLEIWDVSFPPPFRLGPCPSGLTLAGHPWGAALLVARTAAAACQASDP